MPYGLICKIGSKSSKAQSSVCVAEWIVHSPWRRNEGEDTSISCVKPERPGRNSLEGTGALTALGEGPGTQPRARRVTFPF